MIFIYFQYDSYKKDDVVGIIKQKGKGDQYACDVGMKERAALSKFAFEGATKRFRPDLQARYNGQTTKRVLIKIRFCWGSYRLGTWFTGKWWSCRWTTPWK